MQKKGKIKEPPHCNQRFLNLLKLWFTFHNELKCEKNPFWQDNALIASKAKINVVWNFSSGGSPKGTLGEEIFFQKTMILVTIFCTLFLVFRALYDAMMKIRLYKISKKVKKWATLSKCSMYLRLTYWYRHEHSLALQQFGKMLPDIYYSQVSDIVYNNFG